jgi:hypothetical protein
MSQYHDVDEHRAMNAGTLRVRLPRQLQQALIDAAAREGNHVSALTRRLLMTALRAEAEALGERR